MPPWPSAQSDQSTTSPASFLTWTWMRSASETPASVDNPHRCDFILCVVKFTSVVNGWQKGKRQVQDLRNWGRVFFLRILIPFFFFRLRHDRIQTISNLSFLLILLRSCSSYHYHGTGFSLRPNSEAYTYITYRKLQSYESTIRKFLICQNSYVDGDVM